MPANGCPAPGSAPLGDGAAGVLLRVYARQLTTAPGTLTAPDGTFHVELPGSVSVQ
jgi:hypothetical protein